MSERLKLLVIWHEREPIGKTMPMVFRKKFKRCVVILGCFEIFIERPTAFKARAQTWSNYKHHNTIKVLIGIVPQGAISYISKGWGGRVSDKYLTEHCSLLDNLLPGDIILANREFDISDAAAMCCAEFTMPPFTKDKKQLSNLEVDCSSEIARVRMHVERLIGLLRKTYTFYRELYLLIDSCPTQQTDCV